MPCQIPFTADDLRSALNYDPENGLFTWIKDNKSVKAGHVCAAKNKSGYVVIGFKGKYHAAHRLAWLYMTGEWPEGEIDHIDRCRSNNRWSNLRVVSRPGNMHNSKPGRENKWGFVGVHFDKRAKKWVAQIRAYGKIHHIGTYDSPSAAAEAYQHAKARLHVPVMPRTASGLGPSARL